MNATDSIEGFDMADLVNLDALIPREDFLATESPEVAGSTGKPSASRTDLTKGESFYLTLRKPDFQRETAAWTPEAVRDFVKAFVEGDLIPSVICWQSPARLTFIIDGGHRLSAIIAWLQDDYGDGEESIKFYDNKIPEKQRKIAQKTRQLIDTTVGKWKDIRAETQNPGSNPPLTAKARQLAHSVVPLLWVPGPDASKAERAFLTINRSAVQIDPTELKILNARTKANAIAARAIVRNATGYKYWQKFSEAGQKNLESVAQGINTSLYSPPLSQPIRSLDLPIAGHGYGSQTLPLIFDFVNIANGVPVIDPKSKNVDLTVQKEPDEKETLSTLSKTSRLANRLTGTHPSSLGLHPAIYFYSASGRHQPTAVLAVAALIVQLEEQSLFNQFTQVRASYEKFLADHKSHINQLTTKFGSMAKGYRQVKDYLWFVLEHLIAGDSHEKITTALQEHDRYQTLVKEKPTISKQTKEFSQDLKQWKFLSDAMEKAFVCSLCGAKIDTKAMHLDHAIDKKDGGPAASDNANWTHPYCNSTYKPFLANASSASSSSLELSE